MLSKLNHNILTNALSKSFMPPKQYFKNSKQNFNGEVHIKSLPKPNLYSFCQQKKQQSQFKFAPITQKQLELCIPGLAASFAQAQPSISLRMREKEIIDFVSYLAPFALKRGISNIIRDKETDKILGCTVMFDTFDEKLIDYSKIDMDLWAPLLQLLNQVSHDYLQKNGAFKTAGLYAHSFMTGIFPQHKSKHVGRQLFMYQLRSCKQKGYKFVVRETTSHIARKVLLQRLTGYFKQEKYIAFSDFTYKGERIMKDVPHGASLMVSDLSLLK